MQSLKIDSHYICAPDSPVLGMTLATVTDHWIAIGGIGDTHSLLLDSDEWPTFVRFVSELDELMKTVFGYESA